MRRRIFSLIKIIIFASIPIFWLTAQEPPSKIIVKHADRTSIDKRLAPDAARLLGNVEFLHEDIIMTCDSAYYYSDSNVLDAFSRVHIQKLDTSVTVDGGYARYQGNTRFAEIWDSVKLVDSATVMTTNHLYYDMTTNIAYYLDSATIVNVDNTLQSVLGYYHRNINTFYFKNDVQLHSPDYEILTDTLDYNVQTQIADFVGPTLIHNSEDSIYCERGWYNTNDTVALFRQNAKIFSSSTTIAADTLFYDSKSGYGRAFSNINIVDTANNVILNGHIGQFHRPTEMSWVTKHAELIIINDEDSLFMHADTLRSDLDTVFVKPSPTDSLQTANADTMQVHKILKGYYHARLFSKDLQGKADSIIVTMRDTTIYLRKDPVLWNEDNQITADKIDVETHDSKAKKMNIFGKALIVQQVDSVHFNQIKSKNIISKFDEEGELYRVDGTEDAETIYFLIDEKENKITAVNKLQSQDVTILFEDRQADEVTHIGSPVGVMIPPNEFSSDELTLPGFAWYEKLRPVDRYDIFEWKTLTPDSTQKKDSLSLQNPAKDISVPHHQATSPEISPKKPSAETHSHDHNHSHTPQNPPITTTTKTPQNPSSQNPTTTTPRNRPSRRNAPSNLKSHNQMTLK